MEHQELRQLIAARALDALDADEATLVDRHVERCAECARELDDLREVAATIAFVAPPATPPPALRERILSAAGEERPGRPDHAPLVGSAGVRRRRSRVGWRPLALTLAAAAVVLAIVASTLFARLQDVRDQRDRQALAVRALAERGTRLVPVTGRFAGSVLQGRRVGVLVLSDLSPAPSGKTYEAWIIRGGTPVPAGTFDGGDGATIVRLSGDTTGATAVAVTVEPSGGSRRPTSRPILQARLA